MSLRNEIRDSIVARFQFNATHWSDFSCIFSDDPRDVDCYEDVEYRQNLLRVLSEEAASAAMEVLKLRGDTDE